MKVKNIAFSGFMAAILVSSSAAFAVDIASKTYVDNKTASVVNASLQDGAIKDALDAKADLADVEELQQTVGSIDTTIDSKIQNKADKVENVTAENAGGIATVAAGGGYAMSDTKISDLATQESVDGLSDTVTEHTTTIQQHTQTINQLPTTIQNTVVNQLQTADSAINTALNGKLDAKADLVSVDAAAAGNIATVDATGQYQVGTIKATDLATKSEVATTIADAIKDNEVIAGAIDSAIADELGTNGTITNAIDGAISDAVAEGGDVYNAMIPRPQPGCSAASGTCVLSVNTNGDLAWVNVTADTDGTTTTGN